MDYKIDGEEVEFGAIDGLNIEDLDIAQVIAGSMAIEHAEAFQPYQRKGHLSNSKFPSKDQNPSYGREDDDIILVVVYRTVSYLENFEGVSESLTKISNEENRKKAEAARDKAEAARDQLRIQLENAQKAFEEAEKAAASFER